MIDNNFQLIEFGNLIRTLFHVFENRINEQDEEKIKVNSHQFAFLYSIKIKDVEVNQQDMANAMKKDKSVILRTIDVLEEKDLIRRVVDKNDRRKNHLMVTKTGMRVIERYSKIGEGILDKIHEGIDQKDLQVCYKVLDKLVINAKNL
ncbi:MAG: MarR family winged helix-turn-helix transcriptional regulator [Bacteroidota bacterium]|nr:MarR family winged helix-turn-helix transcriptional regulator [Bacteroidota bacterium]